MHKWDLSTFIDKDPVIVVLFTKSCPTLFKVWQFADPVNCSLPGSSFLGIFQARILEWVAIFFSQTSHEWKKM